MALRSIELFAGAGGLALGLESIGVRTVCFVEREAYAAAILASRMGEGRLAPAPVWSDVTTFDGRRWRGVVDLVAGGFPCQDISHAGKGAGIVNGERSGLWREFARIIGEVGPKYVFVENVSALLGRGLDVVLGDLASLGFDAEWGVFRASDVGAPHRRERVFILAHASGGGNTRQDQSAWLFREHFVDGNDVAHAGRERDERRGESRDVAGSAGATQTNGEQRQRRGRTVGDCGAGGVDHPGRQSGDLGPMPVRELLVPDSRDARSPLPMPTNRGVAVGPVHDWPPGPQDASRWRAYLARWPGTEPALRRGADGMAPGPHGAVQTPEVVDDEMDGEEGSPTGNLTRPVQRMRFEQARPAPSPGLEQAARGQAALPVVPCGRAQAVRDLGPQDSPPSAVLGVRGAVPAEAQAQGETVQRPVMPCGDGEESGAPAVACLCNRVDRLRALGNGVVPQQAALAWRVLWERLMSNKQGEKP